MGPDDAENRPQVDGDVTIKPVTTDDADKALRRIEREVSPYFREGGQLESPNGAPEKQEPEPGGST